MRACQPNFPPKGEALVEVWSYKEPEHNGYTELQSYGDLSDHLNESDSPKACRITQVKQLSEELSC